MAYFSRLTEIVTCNLTEILANADDPARAIFEIVDEMREGLAGAQRSVRTAEANEARLRHELDEQQTQITSWSDEARRRLEAGDETEARAALVRKKECQAVVAGLEQQLKAATATKEHLLTTLGALEARLADAIRRQREIGGAESTDDAERTVAARHAEARAASSADAEIDAELESLKKELGRG